jgi:Chaperone of endosialidase
MTENSVVGAIGKVVGFAGIVVLSVLIVGILPNGAVAADKLKVMDQSGNNPVFVVTDDAAAATDPIATVKGEVRPQYLVLGAVGTSNPLGNGRMDFVRGAPNGVSQLLFGTGTPPNHVLDFQMGMFNDNNFQIRMTNVANTGITIAPISATAALVGVGTTAPTDLLTVGPNGTGNIRGVLVQGSSREYKDHIQDLSAETALEAFKELNPVTFTYKESPEQSHVGFIAEDVPELVAVGDRKGVSPMDITAVLTKVVQEQQKTISALAEKVEKLERMLKLQGTVASIDLPK